MTIESDERVDQVGYINEHCEHVLFGFRDPALLNPSTSWVQVAVTVETAKELLADLSEFLRRHDGNTLH